MARLLPLATTVLSAALMATIARAEPTAGAEPEREPLPDATEHPPPSARTNAILGGLGVTAAWYGAAAGMSFAFPDAPGASDLRIPIAGPWLAIAHNGCPSYEPDCSEALVILRALLTALDGIGQAAGPAFVLEGLLLRTQPGFGPPTPEPSRAPSAPSAPRPNREPKTDDGGKNLFWIPLPRTVGARGVGLGISGRF